MHPKLNDRAMAIDELRKTKKQPSDKAVRCIRLDQILAELGMTREHLAWRASGERRVNGHVQFVCVSAPTICKFINGTRSTWPDARRRICEALEMAEVDVFPECFSEAK